jgi:RNA polymerase sigma-70 factor (ECF subfamily)
MNRPEQEGTAQAEGQWFTTTHWSVVLAAKQDSSEAAQAALERLCCTYWYPLYAYVRRRGHSPEDAQDFTQAFFTELLERSSLRTVDPSKGKFRSFLLGALQHFLLNEWDKSRRLKRGGHYQFIAWEEVNAEGRYTQEPSHDSTPDRIFDRIWALTLLAQVLERLKREYLAMDKAALFEALQGYLTGEKNSSGYAELGARLNMGEGAVKMAVLRLRRRYGELLRFEIANTVTSRQEIDEEIRQLFGVLAS